MTLHVRDAGTWKEVSQPYVRDAGTWKSLKEGWVRDAGTWKRFYQAVTVALSSFNVTDFSISPAQAFAGTELLSNGEQRSTSGTTTTVRGTWLLSGAASAYEVFATLDSGALTSGTTGSWLNLGTNRLWSVSRTTPGTGSATITLQIRLVGGDGTILATSTHDLTATTE